MKRSKKAKRLGLSRQWRCHNRNKSVAIIARHASIHTRIQTHFENVRGKSILHFIQYYFIVVSSWEQQHTNKQTNRKKVNWEQQWFVAAREPTCIAYIHIYIDNYITPKIQVTKSRLNTERDDVVNRDANDETVHSLVKRGYWMMWWWHAMCILCHLSFIGFIERQWWEV